MLLKDLAERLIQLGYTPLESRSIDLALRIGKRLLIFEIKSATPDNAMSQMDKGIVQLLRYSTAINIEESVPCAGALIIESCSDQGELHNGSMMLARLGYILADFDQSLPWPQRMKGLNDLLQAAGA